MIAQLAEMAYRKAGQMFFCVQKDARSVTFSYRRARFAAAALAQQLAKRGYGRGTTLACNLYNGAEIVILSLAAAYGGFTLALLNPRLSYEERCASWSWKTPRAKPASTYWSSLRLSA